MGYDVSYHLGAPWYCNHITVVPLLPSVVYRNCKQRGICDLVFWILRDTALLTLKETSPWGSVAGSMAALQVGVSQYAHTAEAFHISWKKISYFLSFWCFPMYSYPSLLQDVFSTLLSSCLEKKA